MRTISRFTRFLTTGIVMLALLLSIMPNATAYQSHVRFERVDIPASEDQEARQGWWSAVSATGRFVAFETDAALSPIDDNGMYDIYLRDIQKETTELISQSPDGLMAVGPPGANPLAITQLSRDPAITSNGRFITFSSQAVNLVAGDTNAFEDVFVYDRNDGSIERVSLSSKNEQTLVGDSYAASIDDNGRFVSFTSRSAELVARDTNDGPDIFVRDRQEKTTVRVSVDSQGNEVETCGRIVPELYLNPTCLILGGEIGYSSVSGNGRHIAFDSKAPNLVEGDTNFTWDVFVHDLETKKTERVSVSSDGGQATNASRPTGSDWGGSLLSGYSNTPSGRVISANGRFVVFVSLATNLVPNDSNDKQGANTGGQDVFVHDRQTGRTERISVSAYGGEQHTDPLALSGSSQPSISSDGRYIGFECHCNPLEKRLQIADTSIYDRRTGANIGVLHPAGQRPDEGPSRAFHPDLASSGRFLTFDDIFVGFWRAAIGEPLGVGGLGGPSQEPGAEDDPLICIEGSCIPPRAAVSLSGSPSEINAALTERGADLIGGAIAYRPALGDLYVSLELESMPRSPALAAATAGVVYGMSFEAEGRSYEIRATSIGLGRRGETPAVFGLFSCASGETLCTKVADIKGGFGTTGERITFSVPLSKIEVEPGSHLTNVKGFTALSSYLGSPKAVLDRVSIR